MEEKISIPSIPKEIPSFVEFLLIGPLSYLPINDHTMGGDLYYNQIKHGRLHHSQVAILGGQLALLLRYPDPSPIEVLATIICGLYHDYYPASALASSEVLSKDLTENQCYLFSLLSEDIRDKMIFTVKYHSNGKVISKDLNLIAVCMWDADRICLRRFDKILHKKYFSSWSGNKLVSKLNQHKWYEFFKFTSDQLQWWYSKKCE